MQVMYVLARMLLKVARDVTVDRRALGAFVQAAAPSKDRHRLGRGASRRVAQSARVAGMQLG